MSYFLCNSTRDNYTVGKTKIDFDIFSLDNYKVLDRRISAQYRYHIYKTNNIVEKRSTLYHVFLVEKHDIESMSKLTKLVFECIVFAIKTMHLCKQPNYSADVTKNNVPG